MHECVILEFLFISWCDSHVWVSLREIADLIINAGGTNPVSADHSVKALVQVSDWVFSECHIEEFEGLALAHGDLVDTVKSIERPDVWIRLPVLNLEGDGTTLTRSADANISEFLGLDLSVIVLDIHLVVLELEIEFTILVLLADHDLSEESDKLLSLTFASLLSDLAIGHGELAVLVSLCAVFTCVLIEVTFSERNWLALLHAFLLVHGSFLVLHALGYCSDPVAFVAISLWFLRAGRIALFSWNASFIGFLALLALTGVMVAQ